MSIFERYIYIAFYTLGVVRSIASNNPDAIVANSIPKIIKEGYLDKILLAQDVCWKTHLKAYGGAGYSFILENGFIILKESESNHSPISVLLYEYYDNIDDLKRKIEALQDNLQCIVSENLYKNEIGFGQTQSPELYDYADNVDTINFLLTK